MTSNPGDLAQLVGKAYLFGEPTAELYNPLPSPGSGDASDVLCVIADLEGHAQIRRSGILVLTSRGIVGWAQLNWLVSDDLEQGA